MAQIFVSADGSQVIPGATATFQVQTANSGLATSGVIMLIGESDKGPDYSIEVSGNTNGLSDNAFGPSDGSSVVAKYGSGPIVDAFNAAVAPLDDAEITGAPSKIIICKTNISTKATSALLSSSSANWTTLNDKSYGQLGNLIYYSVTAQVNETVPTVGSFTWIPNTGSLNASVRVNGGAEQALTLSADTLPPTIQSDLAGLSGVAATGGALRTVLPGASGHLTVAASAQQITITYDATWTTNPSAGDTLVITGASAIASAAGASASGANVGAYVVTGSTNSTIVATKLSDAGKSGAVPGTVTAPVSVSSQVVAATTDIGDYAPITLSLAAVGPSDGLGKSLEVNELTTGTDLFSRYVYALNTTPVTWISKSASQALTTSATEYQASLNVNRQTDGVSETLVGGGQVALQVSYKGTAATITVGASTITSTVSGGAGAILPTIKISQFPTLADLAQYINAQTAWSCSLATAAMGNLPVSALDEGTYNCGTTFGNQTARIKVDAYKLYNVISQQSALVQCGNPIAQPAAGLPALKATTYLQGGTRGGTTAAGFVAALAALERVRGNFVVPCFSQDASTDITAGLTDSSSTYTIAAIHAAVRTHCINMAKLKRKRNRQGFLSIRDTYANAKNAAANVSFFRCSMSFLDQKVVGSDGNVDQLFPYIDAAIAAGGQAAAFYKALVHKTKNISGSIQAAGDWTGDDDDMVEDALEAGLLPTRRDDDGSFYFVSDQTTYSRDANFVFNSIQAVYVADTIALTTSSRMEKAFAGESIADVNATVALTFLESIMSDFMKLKLIAPSDDAALGFKNASVQISGPAMVVKLEVKLAGALYFIPISFLVSQVTQTASQ